MIEVSTYVPFAWDDGQLVKRKVIQCALSRICGGCGLSLGRPIAFLGDEVEIGRNAFHTPPQHAACAERTRAAIDPSWQMVLTSGFEFVRPARDDLDQQLRFEPNSLL